MMDIMPTYATEPATLTGEARALILRLAVTDRAWTRITPGTNDAADHLRANGLADIITDTDGRYAGIRDDAAAILARLTTAPPADLTPAERLSVAIYRRRIDGGC